MTSLPKFLCLDYITYRESTIGKPSSAINDHFDEKDRSIQKKKYKVIKQVYRVKKDRRLNINSDLTLDKKSRLLKSNRIDQLVKLSPMMIIKGRPGASGSACRL